MADQVLKWDEVLALAYVVGWRSDAQVTAVAISYCESNGFHTEAENENPLSGDCPKGSMDRGLWQINDCYHPSVTKACAFDPVCNAKAAYAIYRTDKARGGSGFRPWACYTSGLYAKHLATSRQRYQDGAWKKLIADWRNPDKPKGGRGPKDFPDPGRKLAAPKRSVHDGLYISIPEPNRHRSVHEVTGRKMVIGHPTLELTITGVSQLDLTVDAIAYNALTDDSHDLDSWIIWDYHRRVSNDDMRFAIATFSTASEDGALTYKISARTQGVEALRKKHAPDATGISLAYYIYQACLYARLDYFLENTAVLDAITANDVTEDNGHKRREYWWETAARYAKDAGRMLFEAGGTVYFGRPSWLAQRMPIHYVTWPRAASAPDVVPLGIPSLKKTRDDLTAPDQVEFSFPFEVANDWRPGEIVHFNDLGVGRWKGVPMMVHEVSIALMGGLVSVKAQTTFDPADDAKSGGGGTPDPKIPALAKLVTKFVDRYNGKSEWSPCTGNKAAGISPQCTDGVQLWSTGFLKAPCFPRKGNAKDMLANADPKYWQVIKYTSGMIPRAGDIAVFDHKEFGHVSVVLPGSTKTVLRSIDENWSRKNRFSIEAHTYDEVIGFARYRADDPDGPKSDVAA